MANHKEKQTRTPRRGSFLVCVRGYPARITSFYFLSCFLSLHTSPIFIVVRKSKVEVEACMLRGQEIPNEARRIEREGRDSREQ